MGRRLRKPVWRKGAQSLKEKVSVQAPAAVALSNKFDVLQPVDQIPALSKSPVEHQEVDGVSAAMHVSSDAHCSSG